MVVFGKYLQPSLMIAGKAEAYLRVEQLKCALKCVERMLEYQQAWQMPAPQKFQLRPWSMLKLLSIWWQMQNVLFYVLESETFIDNIRLKVFQHVV